MFDEPPISDAPIFVTMVSEGWPAPGSEDTELRCLMEQEAGHGEAEVYAGVQA